MSAVNDSLWVEGRIQEVLCRCVIDTGSNITIVRPDILGKNGTPVEVNPVEGCLRTVTGETAPVIGRARLRFRIGTFEAWQEAWVAEITDPCIVGLDFLLGHHCQVDIAGATLKVEGQSIPLLRTSERNRPRCCRVVATENVVVPPRSESIVLGTLTEVVSSSWGSVEAKKSINSPPDILVAGTLVNLRSPTSLPVRVMNLSDNSRRIKKGKHLANFEPVEYALDEELESKRTIAEDTGAKEVPLHLVDLYERSKSGLNDEPCQQLKKLLVEYQDVFSRDKNDLGRTGLTKHKIDVVGSEPIRQPARIPPLAKRQESATAIKEMSEQGIIEPSRSPWASPVVLVKKKDGSTRFCVDYRKLNAVTKKDSYPLPRVDTSLHSFFGSTWFSTLNLKSGYWQVEMEEADKEKTAFTTGEGLWQFVVMPFGLSNAPATFERLMEQVLVGLPWSVCLVYLDDIIVHARSFEEELDRLRAVFDRLHKANLKLNPKKCYLFQIEVSYLGYRIGRNGIMTDPNKIEAIHSWPVPRNIAEVRSFFGLCSYYRRFVKSFADKAQPLSRLLTKGTPFEWTDECQSSWETLKQCLTSTPVLSYLCPNGDFI